GEEEMVVRRLVWLLLLPSPAVERKREASSDRGEVAGWFSGVGFDEEEEDPDVACGHWEEGDGGDGEREVGLPEIIEVRREVVASAGSGVVHRRRRDNFTANERREGREVEDWQPLLVVFREVRLLVSNGEGRYRGGMAGSGCCIQAGS
ncbi:hypothetical protein HAX54_006714, partial [Datura stramonium]|nr:hypothetical protein [Datura stramonium]